MEIDWWILIPNKADRLARVPEALLSIDGRVSMPDGFSGAAWPIDDGDLWAACSGAGS